VWNAYNEAMSWMAHEIAVRGGAVSFRDYMELALYHPRHGYYSADRARYGRNGDFLTAPTASRWYGEVVADMLCRLADRVGQLMVVDVGSGDGSFLEHVTKRAGVEVVGRAISIERSAAMRALQLAHAPSSRVPLDVLAQVADLDAGTQPVFVHASELYDAQPVSRVVMREVGLQELWVVSDAGSLDFEERPAPAELEEYFLHHEVSLDIGQIAEANLLARKRHRDLLRRVATSGLAVVLDYGYPAPRLYDSRVRRGGSLACYHEHRLSRDPLRAPGLQDMTAHVNWDDLRMAARETGWQEIGLWPLAEFLVRAGLEGVMDAHRLGPERDLDSRTVSQRQEVKRLLEPVGMGSDLKMLVQGNGELLEAARSVLGVEA
jgi:SAM-dependent MidA family methyltransferase